MSPLCVCPHSVCVSAASIMCGEKLRIPLTSLGPDSCRRRHTERSSSLYFALFFLFFFRGRMGHYKLCVWVLGFKESLLGHTLSPLLSATPLFSPLKAMETRRLSLAALSCISSHYTLFCCCCCPYHTGSHFRGNRGWEDLDT